MNNHKKRCLIISLSSFVTLATALSIVLTYFFVWGRSVLEKHLFAEPETPLNLPHQNQSQEYINAIRDFSTSLNKEVEKQAGNENYVFSPVSVANSFFMLYETSKGEIKQRIADLFHIDDDSYNHIDETVKMIENNYQDIVDTKGKGHTVSSVSQAMIIDESIKDQFSDVYKDNLSKYYSDIYHMDLNNNDDVNNLQKAYFDKKTNNLFSADYEIENKINNPGNAILLSNFFYSAEWFNTRFFEVLKPLPFNNYDGSVNKNVCYIHGELPNLATLVVRESVDYMLCYIPLFNGYHFNILLPKEGTNYIKVLDDNFINLLTKECEIEYEANVDYTLPIFSTNNFYAFDQLIDNSNAKYEATRQDDGICPRTINHFSGIGITNGGICKEKVVEEEHEDTLLANNLPYIHFNVCRPFLYSLTNQDGLPLLIGRVLKL